MPPVPPPSSRSNGTVGRFLLVLFLSVLAPSWVFLDWRVDASSTPPDAPRPTSLVATGARSQSGYQDPGPMELGDRVWYEIDYNGLQNEGEGVIRDVRLQLWCGTPLQQLAVAVIDSDGHYRFVDSLEPDPDPADATGEVAGGIPRATACEIRMPLVQDGLHLHLTLADAPQPANGGLPATDNHPLTDIADSDAVVDGPDGVIRFTTAGTGSANLGLDIGLIGAATSTHTPSATSSPTDTATPTSSPTVTPTPTNAPSLGLGDLVFFDEDRDGRYEPLLGETGISGVWLLLYADDGDGLLDAGDGQPLRGTFSGAGGAYLFAGLLPGSYLVEVPTSNFAGPVSEPLRGLSSSSGNGPAPDPDNDLDGDDNGDPVTGFGVASRAITLALGTEPIDDTDADPNSNRTLDFGFIVPPPPTPEPTSTALTLTPTPSATPTRTPTPTFTPASDPEGTATATRAPSPTAPTLCLGDLLFLDLDMDGVFEPGAGEFGIDDAQLLLYRDDGDGSLDAGDGPAIAAATTGDGGRYGFCQLPPGDYLVALPAAGFAPGHLLAGFASSSGNDQAGQAPDPDDDVDHDDNGGPLGSGDVATRAVTLAAGTEPDATMDGDGAGSNRTVDLGLIVPEHPTGPVVTELELAWLGDGRTVRIRWRTGREEDLLGFRVERAGAADGPWTTIGGLWIPAMDARNGASYAATDRPEAVGHLFYRVVAVAADGAETRSAPAGITLGRWLPVVRGLRLLLPMLSRR